MFDPVTVAVGTLILGWVLGILTNVLTRRYSERRDRKSFVSGALSEFAIIRDQMIRLAYSIDNLNDAVRIEEIRWVHDRVQYVRDPVLRQGMEFHLGNMLNLSEDQFNEISSKIRQEMNASMGMKKQIRIVYSRVGSSFIDSGLQNISLLNNNDRESVMSIIMKLGRFNEQVERHREYQNRYDAEKNENEKQRLIGNMNLSHTVLRLLVTDITNEIFEFEARQQ